MTQGIYLSKWQGRQALSGAQTTWLYNCDLAQLRAFAPNLFIWIKATQGETSVDPLFEVHRQKVMDAGFPCGAFHYLTNRGDPVKQARHFWNVAGGTNHGWTLLPSSDVEDPDNAARADLSDHVFRFFQETDTLWGVKNIPYTRASYWNTYVRKNARSPDPRFAGHKWWIAHYNNSIVAPALPVDAPTWAVWQQGERPGGTWPGLPAKTTIEILNPQLGLADISFPRPEPVGRPALWSFITVSDLGPKYELGARRTYDNLVLMFEDLKRLGRVNDYVPLLPRQGE